MYLENEKNFNKVQYDQDNKDLEKNNLNFHSSDIKYLIVSNDYQIKNLSSFITKLNNFEDDEKNLLKSKIISMKQIKEDF